MYSRGAGGRVRVLRLKPTFFATRRIHAPAGSLEVAVRRGLRGLADERAPVPGPADEQALRTPFETIWSRPVAGTNLVITYVLTAQAVEVLGVRPAWREVR